MRLVLFGLAAYVAIYIFVRSIYIFEAAPGQSIVVYPPDMFWLYAVFWPAIETDQWLTGVPSEMQEQRNIRDA
jgi:hypothetical protein